MRLTGNKISALMVLALIGLGQAESPAAEIKGNFTLGTGYLEHPLGVNTEQSAGYLSQNLQVSSDFGPKDGFLRLGYEGDASQFGQETSLGSMRHGLGLEWFHNANKLSGNMSAGLQGSVRSYQDYYSIYNYSEASTYFAMKKYLNGKTLLRGYAALRYRNFGDLPEESYTEPHGRLELQHYLKSRTTLGFSIKMGAKYFHDPVAQRVWDTTQLPSVSQMAARLNFAQGLTDRLSLRGNIEARWNLSEFPRYVADDVFDSPLLDSYAHDGHDIFLAAKWLGPVQTWVQCTAKMGRHDYGSLVFDTGDGGDTRVDDVLEFGLSLERALSTGIGKAKFKLLGGWRDQDSSLAGYTYAGPYAASSLSWHW